MTIIELVRHYERDKVLHAPISESLGPKLLQLVWPSVSSMRRRSRGT